MQLALSRQHRGLPAAQPRGHPAGTLLGRGSPDASPLPTSHRVASASLDRRPRAFCLPSALLGVSSASACSEAPSLQAWIRPARASGPAPCLPQCASLGSWLRPHVALKSSSLPGPDPLSCPLCPQGSPLDAQAFLALTWAAWPSWNHMLMLPRSVPVGGAGVGGFWLRVGGRSLGCFQGSIP